MFISRVLLASLLLIGFVAAAPIICEGAELELVARAPNKHFTQAKAVMRKIQRKIKPKAEETAFWSGSTWHPGHRRPTSVKKEADSLAKSRNQRTVNQALDDAHIKIPGKKNPYHVRLWNFASKLWAKKAHGEVHAYVGNEVKAGSTYKQVEIPAIHANPRVPKMTEQNLHTGEIKVIKGKP